MENYDRWNPPITSLIDAQSQSINNTQCQRKGLLISKWGIPLLQSGMWNCSWYLNIPMLQQFTQSWTRALVALYHAWALSAPSELKIMLLQSGSIIGKEHNMLSKLSDPLLHLPPCPLAHRSWTWLNRLLSGLLQSCDNHSLAWSGFLPMLWLWSSTADNNSHSGGVPNPTTEGLSMHSATFATEAILWLWNLDTEFWNLFMKEDDPHLTVWIMWLSIDDRKWVSCSFRAGFRRARIRP